MEKNSPLYNAKCADTEILDFFGYSEATYADILDKLSTIGMLCSVEPVETFSTRSGIAYYPVLHIHNADSQTVKKVDFLFMRRYWSYAIEESIKKAIEIIISEKTGTDDGRRKQQD